MTLANFDVDEKIKRVYGYMIQDLSYQLILEKQWMEQNGVVYLATKGATRFGTIADGLVIR